MNISKINLNLLVALDALLSECHVSRAAKKVFITQSAMSNALKQLRELYEDELLIRGAGGMILTQKGLDLKPKVRQVLQDVNALVYQESEFDAATSDRVFYVGMTDHSEFCLLPHLVNILEEEAPNIELKISHLNLLDSHKIFEKGKIELGVGVSLHDDATQLIYEDLFRIKTVVVAKQDHPVMKGEMTLEKYLNYKHMRLQLQGVMPVLTNIDKALEKIGHERDVSITFPHVLPMLFALKRSNLIATMPNFMQETLANKLMLTTKPVPFEVPRLMIKQAWHRQHDNDPGHRWLREKIKQAAQIYLGHKTS